MPPHSGMNINISECGVCVFGVWPKYVCSIKSLCTKPAVRKQGFSRGQQTDSVNWTLKKPVAYCEGKGLKRPQLEQRLGHPANVYILPLPSAQRAQIPYTQHCCVYNHVTFDYGLRCLPASMGSCIPQDLAKFGSFWVKLRQPFYHRTAVGYKQKQSDSVVPIAMLASMETQPPLARPLPKKACRTHYHCGTTRKTDILVWLHFYTHPCLWGLTNGWLGICTKLCLG